jgi:shikimate dehydrogenase
MPDEFTMQSELTAVFGQPVWENPTQVMVEAAYRHHDLNFRYLTIEVAPASLRAAVAGARAMGFRGFNLTIPHKVAVMELLDEIADSARVIGAVNTVVRDGDRLVGHNTDGQGFLESVREVTDPDGASVLVLGAGGAARAICVELAGAGARSITIVNRSPERGRELADHVSANTRSTATYVPWDDSIEIPPECTIVVNATSIGLFPDAGCPPLDFASLRPEMLVADVIPNPPQTAFLTRAAERGCRTVNGLGMLINQGRLGIRLWTGIFPDAEPMRSSLEELFAQPG